MVDLTPYLDDLKNSSATDVNEGDDLIHATYPGRLNHFLSELKLEYRVIDDTGETVALEPVLR